MEWSTDMKPADWIRDRLSPFDAWQVTSVVPGGFEAYARVLHPATCWDGDVETNVRWSEIARWSGLTLGPATPFGHIALVPQSPAEPPPWDGGPRDGSLPASYATALAKVLRERSAPGLPWWFAMWDGHGWESATVGSTAFAVLTNHDMPERYSDESLVRVEPPSDPGPGWPRDPVPGWVRAGPRVELPHRAYFLYSGAPDDVTAFVPDRDQTPNLWWPSDAAWCVASEIDLPYTYVAGSAHLIEAIVASADLEAAVISPDASNLETLPDWARERVEEAADEVVRAGRAVVPTGTGDVVAAIRTGRLGRRELHVEFTRIGGGHSSSTGIIAARDPQRLRADVVRQLGWALLDSVD